MPTPTGPASLELRDVTRVLDSGGRPLTVLDHATLRVEPGEMIAVVGPSGSGKSTMLALMAGLDAPTSGTVLVDGTDLASLTEDDRALLRRRRMGFVFQSFQLLAGISAIENVRLPLDLLDRRDALERARALLAEVGLAERGHHLPSQLSGGEQQRVALARAFAAEPALLLADEPTGNLDSANGARVLELLDALRLRSGTTVVLVTHEAALARRADRSVHLRDGRIERVEARA